MISRIRNAVDILGCWFRLRSTVLAMGEREKALYDEVTRLRQQVVSHDQLKALQMIDEDWYDHGKIILAFHFKGSDRIKIIDVKRKTTMVEYMDLVKQLEMTYGIPPKYVDTRTLSRDWFRTYKEGRF